MISPLRVMFVKSVGHPKALVSALNRELHPVETTTTITALSCFEINRNGACYLCSATPSAQPRKFCNTVQHAISASIIYCRIVRDFLGPTVLDRELAFLPES